MKKKRQDSYLEIFGNDFEVVLLVELLGIYNGAHANDFQVAQLLLRHLGGRQVEPIGALGLFSL